MGASLEKTLGLANQANKLAKELALEIPKATAGSADNLYEKALNMLILSNQIEAALQSLLEQEGPFPNPQLNKKTPLLESNSQKNEVNKLHRRLVKWAQNSGQLNSQILSSYLRLAAKNSQAITEESLHKEFVSSGGDTKQFTKNFPQMKMISERNHGKVFDVVNGIVTIWPPAKDAVDEFIKISRQKE